MFWPYGDFCENKILGYIMSPADIVQKLWNYCNVLRDDGMSYGDSAAHGTAG